MEKTFTIQNPTGIHARPAKKIVTAASKYPCDVYMEKAAGKRINAKSIVGVLALGGKQGDSILVIAEGDQEEAAVAEIGAILESVADEG